MTDLIPYLSAMGVIGMIVGFWLINKHDAAPHELMLSMIYYGSNTTAAAVVGALNVFVWHDLPVGIINEIAAGLSAYFFYLTWKKRPPRKKRDIKYKVLAKFKKFAPKPVLQGAR